MWPHEKEEIARVFHILGEKRSHFLRIDTALNITHGRERPGPWAKLKGRTNEKVRQEQGVRTLTRLSNMETSFQGDGWNRRAEREVA